MLVLGQVKRALGLQHGQQGLGASTIALLCQVEGLACLQHFLVLPQPLTLHTLNGVKGFFNIGKAGEDAAAIVFQQFVLLGFGQLA
ncbi:hypothetical protein D3C73_1534770 [compost metagenome]